MAKRKYTFINRKRKVERKKSHNPLDEESISNAFKNNCCKKDPCCIKNFSFAMIEAFRKDFHSKLQKDKLSLMVGVVRAARSEEKKFNVQGFCICTEAFRRLYGVSKGFLSKCIDLKDSNEIPAHGNLGKSKPRPKSVALRNRLYQYIQDNGDTDPTSTSEKNVPTSLSRIDLLHIVNTDKRFSCSL